MTDADRIRAETGAGWVGIRARSADGRLLACVLTSGGQEVPDPDAGSTIHYDEVAIGLWDEDAGTLRWRTTATPSNLGTGSWIVEHAALGFTADGRSITMAGAGAIGDTAYAVDDGQLR